MASSLSLIEYIKSFFAILLFLTLLLIASPIIVIVVILSLGKATNFLIKTAAPALGRPVLWALGIKFNKVVHSPMPDEPVIYIFNHSSTLDIPTLLSLALERIRIVVKWELQYLPFFFIIGRATGQVFIKRQDKSHAIAILQKTYARLKKDNLSLVIAPEGSRKHEGRIGEFKKGAFRMAIDLGYPIVPIFFEGNDELSYGGSLFSKSGKVHAHIHPAIDTSNWSLETLDTHIEEVRGKYLDWAGVQ